MNDTYIEFVRHEDDFYNECPEVLQTEFDHNAKLSLIDQYGLIFDKGWEDEPVLFVRHGNIDGYRFGAFSRLNSDIKGLQTPLHCADIAQKEETGRFQKLCDKPLTYGYGTADPFSEYRYYSGYSTWKEGDILDVKASPFPYCIIQHQGDIANFTEIIQPSLVTGTFAGRPISFIGSYDKVYIPKEEKRDIGSTMAYILVLDHGIRLDGRHESVVIYINPEGKGIGGYYLEGEEPVSSDDVVMEADWFHLPYVDDGTVAYKDAVFHIKDKTIHFTGRWGCKGITAHPRLEKHGQSQIFGTWYEGDVPYKHQMFTTFHENMEAFDYKFKKLGYKIID